MEAPNKKAANAGFAVTRAVASLFLALVSTLAHGVRETLSHGVARLDRNTGNNVLVNEALHLLAAGSGLSLIRYEEGLLNLADLSERIKRQDIQGSKGSIAVIYPDIGGPCQSVFARIVEGIEGQSQSSGTVSGAATNITSGH